MVENRFNLVEEPWIPVAGKGRVSLADIFTDSDISALGGNPIQKIALTKLLLAIAQAAWTPKDEKEWEKVGSAGMAKKAITYLKKNKELFWLYGEKPFLQVSKIKNIIKKDDNEKNKEPKRLGTGDFPNLPNDNNTILLQSEAKNEMTDADKALFILSLMSFALAGKQCHCNHKKPALVGPSLGRACYLHTYVTVKSIIETIFLNLLSLENIEELKYLKEKLGVPTWEREDLKKTAISYLEMLVPQCRYVFLSEDGIYMVEGKQYPNHKEGWTELTMAINRTGNDIKVMQSKTEKKPWRNLVAILSFVYEKSGYECRQLTHGLMRLRKTKIKEINIWSGGLCVTGDAFGQKVSDTDDYVESELNINADLLGAPWFQYLKQEMKELEDIALNIKRSVYRTSKREIKESKEKDKRADSVSKEAESLFWQLCERKFQELVNACDENSGDERKKLRKVFAGYANKAYDTYCPKDTARQLDAWAANRPNLGKYLNAN